MDSRVISEALNRQEWIRPVEEGLQKAIDSAFRAGGKSGQSVESFLHGTWLGHPLHAAVSDIPVGAYTVTAALDVAEMATGRKDVGKAADAALCVGLTGATVAALSGLTDWHKTSGKARRVGLFHGLANIAATALYTASCVLRRQGRRDAAHGLAFLGFGLTWATAYLGGDLVYEQKVGTDHSHPDSAPGDFLAVMPESELEENRPTRVQANGVNILLVRQGGRIYALEETCSHLGGPLAEGELQGASIVCPWHGSRYRLEDGQVLDGPSTYNQPAYETRIRNGQIEVRARKPAEEQEAVRA